jgi:dinuclear metal center YbgI/SA1388 family protein
MSDPVRVADVVAHLEALAPPAYQASYDNARLLVGEPDAPVTGVVTCLDSTEAVVDEAVAAGANLIVAHHPIVFRGLKALTGGDYVQRTVMAALRARVAICAVHTNLDHVLHGVNDRLADALGLSAERGARRVLDPLADQLSKLVTFAPRANAEAVRQALFAAGAGVISDYDHCSFNADGTGTFRGAADSDPHVGRPGADHAEPETRIELILPRHLEARAVAALHAAHPYEEVAYDLYPLRNAHPRVGAGLLGRLPEPMDEEAFLDRLRERLDVPVVRHTALRAKPVRTVALCGGAGVFLLPKAIAAGADVFVTADVKYHEFFDADGRILLADVGHHESERFTADLLADSLREKFGTFAVRSTQERTNPIRYRR